MERPALELNWITFVFEIINFLVLVWILKHFLYRPVLDVIARRRAEVDKTLANAEAKQTEAKRLEKQYESRLADWERERENARATLARELEAEREKKMEELQTALEQEREKAQIAETRRQTDAIHKTEGMALMQGARFATRLLEQATGPDLEARLVELLISGLDQLADVEIAALHNKSGKKPEAVVVTSAFLLSEKQQRRLKLALAKITDSAVPLRFEQNSELIAGLHITIGALVLDANLRDELKGFMELAHAG